MGAGIGLKSVVTEIPKWIFIVGIVKSGMLKITLREINHMNIKANKMSDTFKELFFEKANYTDPFKYESQYNNEICQKENEEIKRLLNIHFTDDIDVTDIGCGTGLGKTFLTNPYTGIDLSKKSIAHCLDQYDDGEFICMGAEEYIEQVDSFNPMFLFSTNYIETGAIKKAIEKTEKVFFAIHYHKPYLSKTSVYAGEKGLFNLINPLSKRRRLYRLFNEYNAVTFPLLDQDYYWVTVITK